MTRQLTPEQMQVLLERARQSFPHEPCQTCECFLGYVVRLAFDAGVDIRSLLAENGIDAQRTHSCLGCDPCPPADLFAEYLRG